MKSFIFFKLIILSILLVEVRAEQKTNLSEQNVANGNPFLSEYKELKEISFENLRDILVSNNQEYRSEERTSD